MKRFTELFKMVAISLVAVLFTVSCEKPNKGGNNGMTDEDYPEVFVMDDKQAEVVSVTDDDKVILQGTFTDKDYPVGSIIVSGVTDAAPQGFLYKVKSVKNVNGQTVITTENASLEEAIQKGSGSASVDLVDNIKAIYDADGNPVTIEDTKALTVDGSVKLPISVKLQTEREGDGFQGTIDVTGSLELKATMFADLDFDWGLDYFELWAQPELKFTLSTSATLDGKWKFPKILVYSFDIACITIMVGPIPVVITPHMELYLDFEVDGKLKLSCELANLDYKYKSGVQYDGNEWHFISEDSSKRPKIVDNIWTDSDLELEGEFKALNPEVAFVPDLYNLGKVANATKASSDDKNKIKITTGIPFKIKVSNIKASEIIDGKLNPKIKTTWGIEAGVKVNLTVLKKAIVDFNPKVTFVEWVIFDNYLFPEFSALEVVEDNGDQVKFSYKIKDVESVFFNRWYYGFSWSEGTLLDSDDKHTNQLLLGEVDFEEVNTKAGPMMITTPVPSISILSIEQEPSKSSIFIEDGKHNFHVTGVIENLEKGKPYTFRPYAKPVWWEFNRYGDALYYTPGSSQKPIIEVSPSTVSFGTVNKGETSTPQTLTITNKGDGDLNFSLPAATAPFSIEGSNAEYLLKSGESKQFRVTFKPTEEGSFSNSVDITSNATNGTQTITFTGYCSESAGNMEYVDLGLSVKWATCNLGASSPEEYGLYYQWGDTQGYGSGTSDGKSFDWSSYKWCNGSETTLTKYNTKSSYGKVDNKTILEPEDDAARAALGGFWRMPTNEDWGELLNTDNCSWTYDNEAKGYKVQSLKSGYTDKWIFLPVPGYRINSRVDYARHMGYYWSSSLDSDPSCSYDICITNILFQGGSMNRYYGMPIRPVYGDIKVAPTDINFRTRNIGSRAVATFTVTNTGSTAVNVNITVPDAPVTSDFSGDITLNAGTNKTVSLTYTPKDAGSITGKIKVSTAETTINVAYNGKAVQDLNTYSHEYVDLGLSVKWATCNLGASKPEGSGLFYQWGDTQGYGPDTSDGEYFYWNSYMWCNGSETTLTKYNTKSSYGTVDNKTVVEMEDDPARAVLGDKWRMPTYQEWYEIENNCLWTWTTMNDVNGYKVQSKKTGYTDNWIFLPASGCRDYNELTHVGRIGHYWSSSANGDKPKDAYNMFMVSNAYYPAASPRYICYSIRPVSE